MVASHEQASSSPAGASTFRWGSILEWLRDVGAEAPAVARCGPPCPDVDLSVVAALLPRRYAIA
jgi:hypothetical protein